jgi:glutamyl-tRNA synthetase
VDDHDMGVTDIIRGDDHLTNAARQTHIYRALGWEVPRMAHLPLIHGPDGAKLSKRHGALGVDAYRSMGYLPAALRNYLVRLGWSHGDQEVFSTDELVHVFDLDGIGRSPARFDFAKLENLNGIYMRRASDEELVSALEAILPDLGPPRGLPPRFDPELRAKFLSAMPGLKERAKTLVVLLDGAAYLAAERSARPRRHGARGGWTKAARVAAARPVRTLARPSGLDAGGPGGSGARAGGARRRQARPGGAPAHGPP